ncbi:MAG TPA: 6-pyruvoyl-tetrahydropterin synthase-related protein, partial [Anaerolineae bacterium]|nr:6-pyruvoyl-tetrahydropterin synthase-related protein [Anaerolineae bacterium]
MTPSSSFASRLRSAINDHGAWLIVNGSLIMVGLILAAPLLQNAWLCTDDGALHVYRTVALDRALSGGLLYPRWFPDPAFGYGFPFFNYREPLGYYLIEFVHLLGASFPLALNLVLAGSLIAGGLTMNLWVSDIFDRPAGFVAAIVYMAAPYTVLDSLVRSNLPEAIALALLPLILWAFRRLLLRGGRKYFACAGLSLAALLLTHNISSLIFAPVLIVYIVVLCVTHPAKEQRMTRDALRVTLLAFVLALALTSFFWLPALTEGQSAQLYLTHSARGNDYHFNFATVSEVFGPPGTSDPALLNPPLHIVLGWAQIVLAVLGVVLIKWLSTREQRVHVIMAALAAVIFILMALPVSLPLWDALPLIRFVQFPWRFVGRAILPAALLAGAGTYGLFHITHSMFHNRRILRITQYALLAIFTLPVLLSTVPLLYPRVCSGKIDLDINDVFAYEHATGHIGVDPLGAYLPATVVERPSGSLLETQYAAGGPIQRFDRSTLSPGAQIIGESYSPNHA